MADVIITLGRGVRADGTLPPDPCARVQKAVDLYKAGIAANLLMSGAESYHFNLAPALSEAEAMKRYAIRLGAKALDVFTESQSLDTIGNVYFTKKHFCEPKGWRDLIVVASDEHIPRIMYLCQKIYGPGYTFTFSASQRAIDDAAYQKEQEHERKSLAIAQAWIGSITNGDDDAVWQVMKTRHPAYMDNESLPETTGPDGTDLYPDAP